MLLNKKRKYYKIIKFLISSTAIALISSLITSIFNTSEENKKNLNLFLEGQWSTNIQDKLNINDYDTNIKNQPLIVMELHANEYGKIEGLILSKKLCENFPFLHLAFVFPAPSSWANPFSPKTFFIKRLQDASIYTNPLIAKIEFENKNLQLNTVTFKVINNDYTNPLPKQITFVKNVSSFKKDRDFLVNYCNEKSYDWFKILTKNLKHSQKK